MFQALERVFRHKCAYCEQVAAPDIEHFRPKSRYPRRMFLWPNFLLGCKNCNNAKGDHFPLEAGQPLLLDPCSDEPLDYFHWDFTTGATGLHPDPARHRRAAETRDLFRLDREPLREQRRRKLLLVVYLLAMVARQNPVTAATREQLRRELDPSRPWLGIIRQLFRRPGDRFGALLREALRRLPEIERWTSEWL